MRAIAQVDISAATMLDEVFDDLSQRGIALAMAELHFEAREILERAGVLDKIGVSMIFEDLDDALLAFEKDEATRGAH